MKVHRRCFLLASLCLAPALAWSYNAPFTTDADLRFYRNDTVGMVHGEGKTTFQREGISAIRTGGKLLPVLASGRDWLQVDLPPGEQVVEILCHPQSPASPHHSSGNPVAVASLDALKTALGQAKPGDSVVIRNGIYPDWRLAINCQGSPEAPITIRPERPGGVTFMRQTRLAIKGNHLVFRNFVFEQTGHEALVVDGGDDNRFTQLQFFHCGGGHSTFGHIFTFRNGSDRNRVDHCFWTGSKCMSLGIRSAHKDAAKIAQNNRFDHNVFRDITRIWINGQENIQLGSGFPWIARPQTLIEYNLFDNACGDGEICSSKTSGNIFRYNVAAHCRSSAFTLRGGDDTLFEGNVIIDCADGIRVYGRNHHIINNLFLNCRGMGIVLRPGHHRGRSQGFPTTNILVAHNTFVGIPVAVGMTSTSPRADWTPRDNRFFNNIFSQIHGRHISLAGHLNPLVRRNLFEPIPGNKDDYHGDEAILQNPALTGHAASLQLTADSPAIDKAIPLLEVQQDRNRTARPFGKASDLGAVEFGAKPKNAPLLPDIPAPRFWDVDLYKGKTISAYDSRRPLNQFLPQKNLTAKDGSALLDSATAKLQHVKLPDSFVLEFDYRPETFASELNLHFADPQEEGCYDLQWGGELDRKPKGLVHLRKNDEVVAEGPDTVYYRRNYIPSFPGNMIAIERDTPNPELWYQVRLLIHQREIRLILNRASRTAKGKPKNVGDVPVIVWKDRGAIFGKCPKISDLSLQTKGKGYISNLNLWKAEYLGGRDPATPVALAAKTIGKGAVALSWKDGNGLEKFTTYRVYRSRNKDFKLSRKSCVGSVAAPPYYDFELPEKTCYHYAIVAENHARKHSDPARIQVTTADSGPCFRLFGSKQISKIKAPMALMTDPTEKTSFISAPGGTNRMKAPGEEDGYVEFQLEIPKTGTYRLWSNIQAPDRGSDSFYISTAIAEPPEVYYTSTGSDWFWDSVYPLGVLKLETGSFTIRFHIREAKTKLRQLLLTENLDWKP